MAKRKDSDILDSRHSLSNELVEALTRDFRENGVATIQKLRETDPKTWVQTISAVVPRELLIGADRGDESNQPKTSKQVAMELLASVGLTDADDEAQRLALAAWDRCIEALEQIARDELGPLQ